MKVPTLIALITTWSFICPAANVYFYDGKQIDKRTATRILLQTDTVGVVQRCYPVELNKNVTIVKSKVAKK